MPPDLPEKLLGIDIDPAADRRQRDGTDREEPEERVRFVLFGVGEHRLAVPVDDVVSITDVPSTLTRVPRTPEAIEGVTDLRGEITAVIDPTVYFPVSADRSGREQLLVFDCPDDEQAAALRVDDVVTVDTVPESNVLDRDDVDEDPSTSGAALDHPLVLALVERNRRVRARHGVGRPDRDVDADAFEESVATSPERTSDRAVVELVPMIDVDALLSASGHLVSSR